MNRRSATVVGGGAFGLSAALGLRGRGFSVTVIDPGPLPHPLASSTDVSKAVRLDYGSDEFYSALAASALEDWRDWSRSQERPLFHEVGILFLAPGPMAPGSFEGDSFDRMRKTGVPVQRVEGAELGRRFPAWKYAGYVDGYFNPEGGWVESGAVVAWLAGRARAAGVVLREGARCSRLLEKGSRVSGLLLADGEVIDSDWTVVAAGAWTPQILPHVSKLIWATGQPVFHFEPRNRAPFEGERFPVWCADIANTGRYGFPVSADGTVKIGHHGAGRRVRYDEPLEVNAAERERCREFVDDTFADLAGAAIRRGRLCLYCDSWDGDFLIDRDPDRPGLVVAAGGSGHGFKFAPVLGDIVADVVEGKSNLRAARFAWRRPGRPATEQARARDGSRSG